MIFISIAWWKNLKSRLGFLFRQKNASHLKWENKSFFQCFYLGCGDAICMHASLFFIKKRLDSVYHAALRFISRTHHCLLYPNVGWSSLHQKRKSHMLLFIIKSLRGMIPQYISSLLSLHRLKYSTFNSIFIWNSIIGGGCFLWTWDISFFLLCSLVVE